jgi:hypothetical protein
MQACLTGILAVDGVEEMSGVATFQKETIDLRRTDGRRVLRQGLCWGLGEDIEVLERRGIECR